MFDFIKNNLFWSIIIFLAIVSPSFLFGAFQFIFIAVGVLLLIAIVGMWLLGLKVKKMQREATQDPRYSYTQQQQRSSERRGQDPDVKIFVQPNEKRVSNDVGDYVDFEELPDEEPKA